MNIVPLSITPLLLLLSFLLLALSGCASDDVEEVSNTNEDTNSASDNTTPTPDTTPDTTLEVDAPEDGCQYPQHDGFLQMGRIIPELRWNDAHTSDGSGFDFSLKDFYCDEKYDRYQTAMFFFTAEWCGACEEMLAGFKENGTFDKIDAAGGLVLLMQMESVDYVPSTSAETFNHMAPLSGPPAKALFLGDGETDPSATPSIILRSGLIGGYPDGFAVRRSDMLVVSKFTDSSNVYYNLEDIASRPDRYAPTSEPVSGSNCGPEDEEPSNAANNTPAGAETLASGAPVFGGICDDQPDYWTVSFPGRWGVELKTDPEAGDLDFFLWDVENNDYVFDQRGRRLGSPGLSSTEFFQHEGPATLQVFGYNGQTSTYEITLVPLE